MKSKYLVPTLILSLIIPVFSSNSANAILGLSKCEKFKKEILKYENEFNLIIFELNRYQNKLMSGQVKSSYDKLINTNLLNQMWKVAYNNKNCLTNTQKDYLPTLKKMSPYDFVRINTGIYAKNTKYCKESLRILNEECRYTDDDKIETVYSLGSLFEQ